MIILAIYDASMVKVNYLYCLSDHLFISIRDSFGCIVGFSGFGIVIYVVNYSAISVIFHII